MRIIVVSSPDKTDAEIGPVIQLFKAGLTNFHLRKPSFTKQKLEAYIEQIPKRYRKRIIIHSHYSLAIKHGLKGIHLTKKHRKKTLKNFLQRMILQLKKPNLAITRSCYKLTDLLEDQFRYKYVFLSPVFEGISKKSHSGGFNKRSLQSTLQTCNHEVIAMGGIDLQNIEQVKSLGFNGAALLGALWNREGNQLDKFKQAQQLMEGDVLAKEYASAETLSLAH